MIHNERFDRAASNQYTIWSGPRGGAVSMAGDVEVAIVGAGHNGLVAAAYLARAGLKVHLFERRPLVGGASTTEEVWPGFHFSPCAQVIHGIHPKIIRDLRLV